MFWEAFLLKVQLNVMFYDIFHLDCPNCPLELTRLKQNKQWGGGGEDTWQEIKKKRQEKKKKALILDGRRKQMEGTATLA